MRQGDSFYEHLATGGRSKSPFPRPPVYGSGSLWLGSSFRRAKSRFVSVLLPGHRAFLPSKFDCFRLLTHTAWCLPTCWVRRVSFQRPQQLPSCHGFARVGGVISTQMTQNFRLCRPQWAGARRAVRPGFARRIKLPILQEGVPRKTGVWGWGDLERPPEARRSSETHPQGIFGSFLGKQKGTRPAGRNLSYHKKKGFVYQRIIKKS